MSKCIGVHGVGNLSVPVSSLTLNLAEVIEAIVSLDDLNQQQNFKMAYLRCDSKISIENCSD